MANVRVERAPKVAAVGRMRSGSKGLRASGLDASSPDVAFGRLESGGRVVCLSKGGVGFADAVAHCLAASGPADVVLATWTIGAREIASCRQLLDSGAVRSLRLLVDVSFPQRHPAYAAQLRSTFGADAVRMAVCHAKIATVVNDRWALTVLSSANLNRNSRLEFFSIEDCRPLATDINTTLDAWFAAEPVEVARLVASSAPPTVRTTHAAPRPPATLAPATDADVAFFSDDPWGVDLRRAGITYSR